MRAFIAHVEFVAAVVVLLVFIAVVAAIHGSEEAW